VKSRIEISIDDGDPMDTRTIELLNKYGLKGMFYIPSNSWGFENLDCYKDHEVGGHTKSHPVLRGLPYELQLLEIEANKGELEKRLGRKVTSFCYPRGRYSNDTIEILKKVGYEEARTTIVLKTDYKDPFRKHTTIHCYQRSEYEGVDWLEKAKEILRKNPEYFGVWFHSWEITKYDEWDKLEELFKFMSEYDG